MTGSRVDAAGRHLDDARLAVALLVWLGFVEDPRCALSASNSIALLPSLPNYIPASPEINQRFVRPAPEGASLSLEIDCVSHPSGHVGTKHRVVIRADWTVETMHDLEAERLSRALGGWSSCLCFAESVVPAYRHSLEVMADPALMSTALVRGWWHNSNARRFHWHEADHIHRDLRSAVQHEVGEHAVTLFVSPSWSFPAKDMAAALRAQYATVMEVGKRAWTRESGPAPIHGPSGLEVLWENGVLPAGSGRFVHRWLRDQWLLPAGAQVAWHYRRPRHLRRRHVPQHTDIIATGWSSMVASAWWRGFRAAIFLLALAMLLGGFGPTLWKSGVALYEGRLAAFSGLDARDTARIIDGDPLSTFHSHTTQLGFASYSYSPIAGAFSLYFGANAGSNAHIATADLTCTAGSYIPFKVGGPSYAFLIAAPTGCQSLNFTIIDRTGGVLNDSFDLTTSTGEAKS
jgi:hypothetical protein